jgi:transglutaminase-like putative cysteine protease
MVADVNLPTRAMRGSGPEYKAEGITLALHAMLILSVVAAMNRVDANDRVSILAPLALLGLGLGYWLTSTAFQDLIAHSIALWTGVVAAVALVGVATVGPAEIVRSRGEALIDLIRGVGTSIYADEANRVDDTELLVVLGITAWLLAYSSAWVLYRRGWFMLGVAVPASILLASLRVDDRNGGWPLALFVFAAIGLAARNAVMVNSTRWVRRNMSAGQGLTSRFLFAAMPVALVAAAAALLLNPATHDALSVPYRETAQSGWNELRDRVESAIGQAGSGSGSYASFPDDFNIGGEIDLGDEVVARVESNSPHYLALRRYDVYDGRGWSSGVQSTFVLDGDDSDTRVTNVIFADSQSVALSGEITNDRQPSSALITVVRPKDDLIFTVETFSSASRQVYAVLGWRRLDTTEIDVDAVDLAEVPVDLQSLVRAVRGAEFRVDEADGTVTLADPATQGSFDSARQRLVTYPVDAKLSVGVDGQLLLLLSGRIPNYDDIEALFTSDALRPNSDYRIVGLASTASPDELASASTDYPAWIANRYLQLPEEVTERTRAEAQRIAIESDSTNAFDMVWAIQEYLRTQFTYELNSPSPPDGQDWVDYFLFDHQAGRCEQFASAMVVMVRSVGIPARLVSGYRYSGETNGRGEAIYRDNQAHTWVEVFFPEYGWIPFEPTTNQDEFTYGQGREEPTDEPQSPGEATPTLEPTLGPDETPRATAEATPEVPALAVDANDDSSSMTAAIQFGAIVIAAICLLIAGALVLRWQWLVRGLAPASSLYARLQRIGAWFGVRGAESTTPNEFGRALSHVLPGSESAVRSITNAYYAERFDPTPASRTETLSAARNGWKQLRRNLLRWRIRRPKPR